MSDKKNDLPKVFPFVQPEPKPLPPTLTTPRKAQGRVSQRGLLSVLSLILSIGALTAALGGGAKLILDILEDGLKGAMDGIWIKAVVLGLAYAFGWISAVISIRVYGNLILSTIIKVYTWATLLGTSGLYVIILDRLFNQKYDLQHYVAYLLITAAGLAAVVGLHLVLEGHDLRPFAIPLLAINLGQLGLIVVRYVFIGSEKIGWELFWYLIGDLVFFVAMLTFSILMVAHFGLLDSQRQRITKFFDQNSVVIRPES